MTPRSEVVRVCRICGGYDHWSGDCPKGIKVRSRPLCDACKAGHMAREFPSQPCENDGHFRVSITEDGGTIVSHRIP